MILKFFFSENKSFWDRKPFIFHYVGPTSVWAKKNGQKAIQGMKGLIDHLFLLYPFEQKYYEKSGLSFSCVGPPILEVLNSQTDNPTSFRSRYRISNSILLIALLPGSRMQEVERLLPVFHQTLTLLKKEFASFRVLIPTTFELHQYIQDYTSKWNIPSYVICFPTLREKLQAFMVKISQISFF